MWCEIDLYARRYFCSTCCHGFPSACATLIAVRSKVILQAPDNNTASCVCHYIHLSPSAIVVNSHKKAHPCWKWAHQVYCKVPPHLCWHGLCLHRRRGGSGVSLTCKAFLAVSFHYAVHIQLPHFRDDPLSSHSLVSFMS